MSLSVWPWNEGTQSVLQSILECGKFPFLETLDQSILGSGLDSLQEFFFADNGKWSDEFRSSSTCVKCVHGLCPFFIGDPLHGSLCLCTLKVSFNYIAL